MTACTANKVQGSPAYDTNVLFPGIFRSVRVLKTISVAQSLFSRNALNPDGEIKKK